MAIRIIFAIAVAFGVLRFIVPVSGTINTNDIYKDLAHCFVSGVFVAAFMRTRQQMAILLDTVYTLPQRIFFATLDEWQLWSIAWGLTTLEVVAFFVRSKGV